MPTAAGRWPSKADRQRRPSCNKGWIGAASPDSIDGVGSVARNVSSAWPTWAALVARMSSQSAGALPARRVVSASPGPANCSPSLVTAFPATAISVLLTICGR